MRVPSFDLSEQNRRLRGELMAALGEVVDSGHFILGDEVLRFEEELARLCGVKHAIGVANGSDALYLALVACGIGSGDEVITTPFTFFATAGSIVRAGGIPVFADIDTTYNIDPAEVERRMTPKTKAILPVHLYGHPAEMDAILDIARRHDVKVVEDAAQAIGAEYCGRRIGSIGDAACISFFPTKNLGAFGDAGAVVTNDDEIDRRVRMLRVHGSKKKYTHEMLGINSRLDSLQARILRVKIKYLSEWTEKRRGVADFYQKKLARLSSSRSCAQDGPLCLPVERDGCRHVYHQYTVAARQRDALKAHLAGRGIGSTIYYPLPLHLQQVFSGLRYKKGDFPKAEEASLSVLSLPMFPEMTEEQVEYVTQMLAEFVS